LCPPPGFPLNSLRECMPRAPRGLRGGHEQTGAAFPAFVAGRPRDARLLEDMGECRLLIGQRYDQEPVVGKMMFRKHAPAPPWIPAQLTAGMHAPGAPGDQGTEGGF